MLFIYLFLSIYLLHSLSFLSHYKVLLFINKLVRGTCTGLVTNTSSSLYLEKPYNPYIYK